MSIPQLAKRKEKRDEAQKELEKAEEAGESSCGLFNLYKSLDLFQFI